ncbi:sensor histidine kinase [Persicitalea jodogahamensis]|nr:HAMP domain-containing sensor histidine kinase [Persicitalea jodogahamensis]
MTTSRIKWSFVLLGLVAFFSAIALITGVSSWAGGINTQFFYSGAFAASLLLSIVVMAVLGWRLTESKDSSQSQMDFMYKMTHELQTPVSSITLAANMLENPSVSGTPERLAKYVRIVKEESNRMQWHIDNVLHIAKAENRTLLLKPEKTAVDSLVSNLLSRYDGRISSDLKASEASVTVDRQHFSNVLFNLIDNALKYTPVNPQIWVCTQQVADKVVVSVRDNGIGIPQHEQKKIFNNFYRIQNNSANVKGFGLGLSYVQQIAQAHHWNLELESQEGEGSDFRIVLPVSSSA